MLHLHLQCLQSPLQGGHVQGKTEVQASLPRSSLISSLLSFWQASRTDEMWRGHSSDLRSGLSYSATMVTSLPSHYFRLTTSVSLSLSLSLSPIVLYLNVPHAQYRKRFRASYN